MAVGEIPPNKKLIRAAFALQEALSEQALVAAHEKKFWMEQIEVECNEAVLAEREACAKVCEEIAKRYQIAGMMVADECAEAIRARGEK